MILPMIMVSIYSRRFGHCGIHFKIYEVFITRAHLMIIQFCYNRGLYSPGVIYPSTLVMFLRSYSLCKNIETSRQRAFLHSTFWKPNPWSEGTIVPLMYDHRKGVVS